MDITQFKKEREAIISRLAELETQQGRLRNVAAQVESKKDKPNASVLLEPLLVRLNALEDLGLASKLTQVQKDIKACVRSIDCT
jgi:hypothetical protein